MKQIVTFSENKENINIKISDQTNQDLEEG